MDDEFRAVRVGWISCAVLILSVSRGYGCYSRLCGVTVQEDAIVWLAIDSTLRQVDIQV